MGKKAKIKLDIGTVYQKDESGTYYFRYQIQHERKCVSLKTQNQEEAIRKARELLPVIQATTLEVISAHVKVARNLAKKESQLALKDAWEIYSKHPDKASPATRHEELSYGSTFAEFVRYAGGEKLLSEITPAFAEEYANHLKTTEISVTTHNRKIKRIRKIFSTLSEYYSGENPFKSPNIQRKTREEQRTVARRIAFNKDQEEAIRQVLDDPKFHVMNKNELKVIYYLGMYTGQRLKDCVLLQWQAVDFQHNRIFVKQFKTGKEVLIPIAKPLKEVLEAAQVWRVDSYVSPKVAKRYLTVDKQGKSVGDNFVNVDVMRVIKHAGMEPNVEVPGRKRKMTVYGFHSLRHSFASHCAEAGVPKAVVISILGATSEIVDQFYTHVGEEAQMKALEAITGESASKEKSAEERIQRVLTYLRSIEISTPELSRIEAILTEE